jgi:hypothetical protein
MNKALTRLPAALHAFGNATRPRPPRVKGYNVKPN